MDTQTIYSWAFGSSLILLVLATAFGIAAIWVPDFWQNEYARKFFWTGTVLFGVSLTVAIITKLLGASP